MFVSMPELFAANRLVYASAFEGMEADLVLVWKHNLFSHDVIFRFIRQV
jgi:hypothetical protein